MYIENRKLKQARKNIGISLQDMAYLLDVDVSNLSKYERGLLKPTREILYGYHCVTQVPFGKLQKPFFMDYVDNVSSRITSLISKMEEKKSSSKHAYRIESMYSILNNVACLKDANDKSHE
ncbi:MAG: helix-turn-helix transcriptional regulator [Flavobacteriales bacterium]|nr:helix-turn-helix transcriptional regulator [Flavobacteriales bacterium]